MKRKIARQGRCKKTGKVKFRDEKSATAAMRNLTKHAGQHPSRAMPVRVYECEFCGGWHWTSRGERW